MRVAASTSFVSEKAMPSAVGGVWSRYLMVAASATALDLLTKEIATRVLGDSRVIGLTGRASLMLVYNTGTAGGFSVGPFTFALNVVVTVVAIAMVMRIMAPLSAIDSRATLALALVTGGAMGNLLSMVAGPAGVCDFLSLRLAGDTSVVMNVADLMLWSGALLLVPVVVRMIGIIRSEREAI